jgi:phage baseplate assembly protein W
MMRTASIDIPNRPYWQPKHGSPGETVVGLDEVGQAIDLLFSTLPGSVPLLPEYGFDWLKYLDRPISAVLRKLERGMIAALRRWEPRVDLVALRCEPLGAAAGSALAAITWKLKGSNEAVIQVLGLGIGRAL